MKPGEFPTQKNCDPKKPTEAFAWMLVAPPHIKGAALPFSSEYLQLLSKRLWDCGARPMRKYQKIKWRPPGSTDPHWLTNPGNWVNVNEPDPPGQEVNMLTVLEAMKKADEKGFFNAVDKIGRKP